MIGTQNSEDRYLGFEKKKICFYDYNDEEILTNW